MAYESDRLLSDIAESVSAISAHDNSIVSAVTTTWATGTVTSTASAITTASVTTNDTAENDLLNITGSGTVGYLGLSADTDNSSSTVKTFRVYVDGTLVGTYAHTDDGTNTLEHGVLGTYAADSTWGPVLTLNFLTSFRVSAQLSSGSTNARKAHYAYVRSS